MSQLIVRNVEPELVRRLKLRAARHGRSTEAEHRHILRSVLAPGLEATGLKQLLLEMPDVGSPEDFERFVDRGRVFRW